MSANDSGMDGFDSAVENLSEEATQALNEVEEAITASQEASDEVTDVATPVYNSLMELSDGDRAAAVQELMVLFSDDMAQEIQEARSASLAALTEVEEAVSEGGDVLDALAQNASDLVDAISQSDLANRIRSAF